MSLTWPIRITWITPTVLMMWLAGCALGASMFWNYALTSVALGQPPNYWPEKSRIIRELNGFNIVLFAHTHCPCTRASLRELADLLADSESAVMTTVVFRTPSDVSAGTTENWIRATQIPGANVVLASERNPEHRRFRATISGEVFAYDSRGQLVFHGGITAARGHQGRCDGLVALQHVLAGDKPLVQSAPVFGCPLN